MMNCKTYIFKLTSGQLKFATGKNKFWALQHRLMCKRCRAFAKNDDQLSKIIQDIEQNFKNN